MARQDPTVLADLDDVAATAPALNEILTWGGVEWGPAAASGVGTDLRLTAEWATTPDLGNIASLATYTANVDGGALILNDRVLVKNQTTASENGLYEFNGTGLVRHGAMLAGATFYMAQVFVEAGNLNGKTTWRVRSNAEYSEATVGTDLLQFFMRTTPADGDDTLGTERRPIWLVVDGATTANVADFTVAGSILGLSGVSLTTGQTVLVKDQITAIENGIYWFLGVGNGWERHPLWLDGVDIGGMPIRVTQGTNSGRIYLGDSDTQRISFGGIYTFSELILQAPNGGSAISDRSSAARLTTRGSTDSSLTLATHTGTIDGTATAVDDRILVRHQATASQNGLYVRTTAGLERVPEYPSGMGNITAIEVLVTSGTTYGNTLWRVDADSGDLDIGTDALNFNMVAHHVGDGDGPSFERQSVKAEYTATGNHLLILTLIDGIIAVNGDVILLTQQTTTAENGLYIVENNDMVRHPMYPTGTDIDGLRVYVKGGNTLAGSIWRFDLVTIGTGINSWTRLVELTFPETQYTSSRMELGGVQGPAAVGSGTNVPNAISHVATTLLADTCAAVATIAPTGSALTFDVRLEPAGTVITTGTIAAAANVATFTVFADQAITTAQWIESRVTAIGSTTPGSELVVTGLIA